MANILARGTLPLRIPGRAEQRSGTVWLRLAWVLAPWLIPVLGAAIWTLGTHYGWISPQILPPPAQVFSTLHDLAVSGDLWVNVAASVRRILVGFALGVVVGVLLGALFYVWRVGGLDWAPKSKLRPVGNRT